MKKLLLLNRFALFFFCLFICSTFKINASTVTVSGRQILVDGNPYIIKGVCYNPVPIGSSTRNFSSLAEDLLLMKEAGINTIRVYTPITDINVLNDIADAGLKVIIGFGYNQGGNFDILSGTFINYINTYKNHNAILLWELGNEYNYHPEWFEGNIENWYTALNNAAATIHANDPNHPVATAHGELPSTAVLSSCPNIDVWGLNVYRWDNPEGVFPQWSAISTKPMYLSEAGADRYMTASLNGYTMGENERAQADATENILNDIFNATDICSGVALFAFIDEWWKAGNNSVQDTGGMAPNSGGVPYDGAANEEYWGIIDIHRNKKEAFYIVKTKYNSIFTTTKMLTEDDSCLYYNPTKDYIHLNNISEFQNIDIFDANDRLCISLHDIKTPSIEINTEKLHSGLYIIHLTSSKEQKLLKFIKK